MAMKKSKAGRCQCCHKALTDSSHLVFGDEGRTLNIAKLLFDYIKKSLDENDGVNYAICDPCWQQLIKYNEFQQNCIRANEMACTEEELEAEDEDANYDDEVDRYELVNMEVEKDGSDETQEHNIHFAYQYECDEELVDDMQIEYLDENDPPDEENWYNHDNSAVPLANVGQKKLPFDFQPVLVKPIFMFGIGKFFTTKQFASFLFFI